ncbi:NAD(+) synthase [Candidatus Micrarchaeota archaeon]|nr:NAD(+) synthase [Candidatus Micrarchaeota archaeon]
MASFNSEAIFNKLVSGLRDYAKANGFTKAVLGLSGGIDSTLTACIAVEALGAENVLALSMPSKFSSKESVSNSEKLAKNLGIELKIIPINNVYDSLLSSLSPHFAKTPFGTAEENLQARIRGNILMAFSNKFGHLVLSTGNKSELLTGYCTLYGDLLGGVAVIANVYKTQVYALAKYYNSKKGREIILQAILEKHPSAELKPNQRDSDSLPLYEILDPILTLLVDEKKTTQQIISSGFDAQTVEKTMQLYEKSEFKRKQAPPAISLEF